MEPITRAGRNPVTGCSTCTLDGEGPLRSKIREPCRQLSMSSIGFFFHYSNNASCESDKFTVDTHLCKLRDTPVVRFKYVVVMNQSLINSSNGR